MESCSSNVTKLQICKLNQDYAQSFPSKPWPMIVNNSVRVLDIVEFNADANTMTIFVQLMAWWDDTELTLKSNDPDELVLKLNQSIFKKHINVQMPKHLN